MSAVQSGEAREASGITSRLVLTYVEREAGRDGVEAVLAHAGLSGREQELRDEDTWIPFRAKVALLAGAAHVLDDPHAAQHIGSAVLDLDIAPGLKRVMRALGSPRLVYREVVRACAKFNATHRMTVDHLDRAAAVLRYEDVSGVGTDLHDCRYNIGLLACVPALFGLPAARVEHRECAVRGADACVYEVRWTDRHGDVGRAAPAAASAATVAASAAVAGVPGADLAAGVLAAGAAVLTVRADRRAAARVRSLTRTTAEHAEASERLAASLRDLSADLRPDEVLAKIARNAQAAVGGKEFALLVAGEEGMRCAPGSRVPPMGQAALAGWADAAPAALERDAVIVDDVRADPALDALAASDTLPLGSLCAAPLRFRGRCLGVLVALAHAPAGFLPHDAELLTLYATEAAIALSNAEVVDRLQRLADEDPLTGLANHRTFHARLGEEVSRADRTEEPFSVVAVDLDRFGRINALNGHAEGDRVLRAIARALRDALRPYDVAGRVAGQQFALVLPGVAPADAERIAERVRADVASVRVTGASLTCSAGIAGYPADGRDASAVLEAAFDALLDAKDAGRDRTRRADPGRAHDRAERAERAAKLRAAVGDPDAVAVVFQPIADLATGTIRGFEALARFPTLGLRPDVAIAEAHACGIGPELEAMAIRSALAEPGRPPGTTLTVNVSLSALGSPNVWAELPVDLTGITIEVTEHELFESDEHLGLHLRRLRDRGAKIAVDDTGSGYAGLQQLARVRPDMVKLDRALVDGVSGDRHMAALIEAFVSYCAAVGALVCAEGVEELDDLRELARLGVGSAQGYGLARPAPGFTALLPEAVAVLRECSADGAQPLRQ